MSDASAPAVEIENLRFRWAPGAPVVLDMPAFRVATGERVFVEGPSGSGKTTLLNLLGGVSVPESGKIAVFGNDLARLRPSARDRFRADTVGFVFQMFNLVPYLSMTENVALPCRFSRTRRDQAERAGGVEAEARRLLGALDLYPDTFGGRAVAELSIGQQQRVAAARALIGAPRLVIADEPTSALDTGNRDAFLKLLIRACDAAGATLLFVSHDGGLAARFQRRVDMRVLNRATHEAA